MAKLILRIVYFAISIIIAVFVGMIYYQSSVYQEIYDKTQEWIKNEDYDSLARMYCGYFDRTPIISDKDANGSKLLVLAGTQEETFNYYRLKANAEAGSTKDSDYDTLIYHQYEYAYDFLFVIPQSEKAKYNTKNIDLTDKKINNFGIRFYDKTDKTKYYDYKYELSNTVNKDDFIYRPMSVEEGKLHGTRTLMSSFYSSWGFFRSYINKSTLDLIETTAKIDIGSFNMIDNTGNPIFEGDYVINMEFNEDFFKNIAPLKKAYDEYINIYNDYNVNDKNKYTKEEYTAASNKFKADIDAWSEEAKAYPNYLTAFNEKDVVSSSPIWKTVGVIAIYVLAVLVIYLLLFEFKRIKRLIFRERRHERYVPNKLPEDKNNPKNGQNNKPNNK